MSKLSNTFKWPKEIPAQSQEQKERADDFMNYWLSIIKGKYGLVETFNHKYPLLGGKSFSTTLELGAGRCAHLSYETLTPEQEKGYYAIEYRSAIADIARKAYPRINVMTADCQKQLPFPDAHFDRVLAIHVLEHLPDLPATIKEVKRLLKPTTGTFSIVIPCLESPAYTTVQRFTSARLYKQRYDKPYAEFIDREHINSPEEIIHVLKAHKFNITRRIGFPMVVPYTPINLCMGLTATV